MNNKTIEDTAKDYAAYFQVDVLNGFTTVQDVVDNMLTRLEELTSVLQMIKLKNSDCGSCISNDISKYRCEVNVLSKKISILINVMQKLYMNAEVLEKQIEKAEIDFGVNNDNKIKSLLRPFLNRNKNTDSVNPIRPMEKINLESVLSNFGDSKSQ